jgi:hypothetical protein
MARRRKKKKKKNNNKKKGTGSGSQDLKPVNIWKRYSSLVGHELQRLQWHQHFVDSYEDDDLDRSKPRIKPAKEIAKSQLAIVTHKRNIVGLFERINGENSEHVVHKEAVGYDCGSVLRALLHSRGPSRLHNLI